MERFSRSTVEATYLDTAIGRVVTASPFAASGRVVLTAVANSNGSTGNFIGHINRDSAGAITTMFGIYFDVMDRFSLIIRNSGGQQLQTDLISVSGLNNPPLLPKSTWSYSFNPTGGSNGQALFSATVTTDAGVSRTASIEVARAFLDASTQLNAFGIVVPAAAGPNDLSRYNIFWDDLCTPTPTIKNIIADGTNEFTSAAYQESGVWQGNLNSTRDVRIATTVSRCRE